jgi:hypothetical protein
VLKALVREAEERRAQEWEWATRHPSEWSEWVRLAPLLDRLPEFGAAEYDFAAFLAEVGPRPSAGHAVERRDETLPYRRGNLTWRKARRATEPPQPASPYLTTCEAADYCRRQRQTILNHHSLGHVRSMPGKKRPLLFRREELDRWLETRRKNRKK